LVLVVMFSRPSARWSRKWSICYPCESTRGCAIRLRRL